MKKHAVAWSMSLCLMLSLQTVSAQFFSDTNSQTRVNYFDNVPPDFPRQRMVMQVHQTTTVTFISAPITSPLSQFVLTNPQGLLLASQRANRNIQNLAIQAANFKRLGLDSLRSDRTYGRHTIFIATKPASLALMDDKTLIDFLLSEIFFAMGLSNRAASLVMRDVNVFSNQGVPDPKAPPSVSVTQAPIITTTTTTTTTTSRTTQSLPPPPKPLTCQSSVKIECDLQSKFRTADGTCNNLLRNLWGSSLIPHRRFLPPVYQDGISAPRVLSRSGNALPSARVVSNIMHRAGPERKMTSLTHIVMQWGQFLDHDFTSTPIQTASDGSALTCCEDEIPRNSRGVIAVNNRTACFPISIPFWDPFFKNRNCFSFPRSVQVTNANCQQSPVEQLNQITAFLDGSQVYGSTAKEQLDLRTLSKGLLKSSGQALLPKETKETCVLHNPAVDYCFKAGDGRVNEQMGLASMHTVWMREHNRLATRLGQVNPHWNDERIFQEGRKILGAMLQKITFGEWLPLVLDKGRLAAYKLQLLNPGQMSQDYDPNVDPSIRNVFATAAFRFGHSLIRDAMTLMTHDFVGAGETKLENLFGNTSQLLSSNGLGVDMYVRGLVRDEPNLVDRFFTPEIQDHLFQDRSGNSLDLIAFNIQRARDHGIPGYNAWRQFCNMPVITSFADMPEHDLETRQALSQVYEHPDDIDVFTGSISEQAEGSGILGPTFSCIIAEQLRNLKVGDRFWFETSDPVTGFTAEQLEEIRKHSLARVLCDNTATSEIQVNPFWQVFQSNPMVHCEDLPEIDIEAWREGPRLSKPVSTEWSDWSVWSECLQGSQRRTRVCQGFATPCSGAPMETRACTLPSPFISSPPENQQNPQGDGSNFNMCNFFNMPAFC